MRTKLLLSSFAISMIVNAQGTWTQKANIGGTARSGAVGFSIGNKAYIGTGDMGSTGSAMRDFWEWDQSTNVWTQKSDFGGSVRSYAVGFSIGTKGYIGTGQDNYPNPMVDFLEYDPSSNTWIQKADFGGTPRGSAVGFSIGTKGYIGTGGGFSVDFWEWDQITNVWAKKADFGGIGRFSAVGFSIGTKGYIGTGCSNIYAGIKYEADFWEWDQATNVWTQKADFGGSARCYAVGFQLEQKAIWERVLLMGMEV
jgi:hypothetical protein